MSTTRGVKRRHSQSSDSADIVSGTKRQKISTDTLDLPLAFQQLRISSRSAFTLVAKPRIIAPDGLLEGYTVTIHSTQLATRALLETNLPSIIENVLANKDVLNISQLAEIEQHNNYSISLSAGALLHLHRGTIASFVLQLKEVSEDEAIMKEKNMNGYHNYQAK